MGWFSTAICARKVYIGVWRFLTMSDGCVCDTKIRGGSLCVPTEPVVDECNGSKDADFPP